jgi:hypothetical protein
MAVVDSQPMTNISVKPGSPALQVKSTLKPEDKDVDAVYAEGLTESVHAAHSVADGEY